MNTKKLLFLRGGFHKDFAFKSLFKKDIESIILDSASSKQHGIADYSYITDDKRSTQKMFDEALRIYEDHKYDGVCTFMSSSIVTLGMLSDHFGLDYFSAELAKILSSKLETRKYLRKIGADTTAFFEIDSYEALEKCTETLKYPFVIKPTDNSAGNGVIVVNKPEDLRSSYDFALKSSYNKLLIAEEFLRGDEYCVEVLILDHHSYILAASKKFVTEKTYCVELIDVTPAPIAGSLQQKIERYITETLDQIDIKNAIIHIEMKIDEDENIRIIEINPRTAGANLLESLYHLKGLNPYDYLFDLSVKNEIDIEKLKAKLAQPFGEYSLFYSFISPDKSGKIKAIKGIPEISRLLDKGRERLILEYDKGDYLPEVVSNNEARGFIYLFDKDYEKLLERAKKIENMLDYIVEP